MFGQREAVMAKEEEEEAGKVMSGDDFHIREVLKPGGFYNIRTVPGTCFPATGTKSKRDAPASQQFRWSGCCLPPRCPPSVSE